MSPVSRLTSEVLLAAVVALDVERGVRAPVLDLELRGLEVEAVARVLGLDGPDRR